MARQLYQEPTQLFPNRIHFLKSDISDFKSAVHAAHSQSKSRHSLYITFKEVWRLFDFGTIHLALSDGTNHSNFKADKSKTANYERIKMESPSQFYDGLFGSVLALMEPSSPVDTCLSLFLLHGLQATHPQNKLVMIKINNECLRRFTGLRDEVKEGKDVEGLSDEDQGKYMKILNTLMTRSRFCLIVSDCTVPNSITLNTEMGVGIIAGQQTREAQVQTLLNFSKMRALAVLEDINNRKKEGIKRTFSQARSDTEEYELDLSCRKY